MNLSINSYRRRGNPRFGSLSFPIFGVAELGTSPVFSIVNFVLMPIHMIPLKPLHVLTEENVFDAVTQDYDKDSVSRAMLITPYNCLHVQYIDPSCSLCSLIISIKISIWLTGLKSLRLTEHPD